MAFTAHNNALLRQFLDRYGFEYEFASSTDYYAAGRFDEALRGVLRHYRAILDIMLPTLGEERRATYSPVLPVSPTSGIVLQVPVEVLDAEAGLIAFDDGGTRIERCVFGGRAKLQWKVDWAMRWVALGVDYEMAGKDLIDSVVQSGKIARVLGARPPEGFNYEMFLDETGQKISKSKGNGLTLDEWLAYGPEESLAFFAYREPKKAKQLLVEIVDPSNTEEVVDVLTATDLNTRACGGRAVVHLVDDIIVPPALIAAVQAASEDPAACPVGGGGGGDVETEDALLSGVDVSLTTPNTQANSTVTAQLDTTAVDSNGNAVPIQETLILGVDTSLEEIAAEGGNTISVRPPPWSTSEPE